MQCSACRAVYSNGLEICPRCKAPVANSSHLERNDAIVDKPMEETSLESTTVKVSDVTSEPKNAGHNKAPAQEATPSPVSTLIEFPGVTRAALPQWRKDLSERVRLIQERRAREAGGEGAERHATQHAPPTARATAASSQLGLVPPPDTPPLNPLVEAALRRIERARQPSLPHARSSMSGAAMAFARVVEEEQFIDESQTETALAPVPAQVSQPAATILEVPLEQPVREHSLVIVPAKPIQEDLEAGAFKRESQRAVLSETAEAAMARTAAALESKVEATEAAAPVEELYDDRAPVPARIAGSMIDLLVVAFASMPFAAIIELTNGNWADARISGSMCGISAIVMFLYLTTSTALAGRTWGMTLVSLRAVDAETGLLPTTRQSVARAFLYILSLATFGIGILYALFDAEGRAAHDHFSGTTVVRE